MFVILTVLFSESETDTHNFFSMQGIAMETKKQSRFVLFLNSFIDSSAVQITAMPTFRHYELRLAVPVGKMKRRFSEAKRRNGVSSFAVSRFSLFSADFFSL